jgi:fatty-acid desaturase
MEKSRERRKREDVVRIGLHRKRSHDANQMRRALPYFMKVHLQSFF